MAPDNFLDMLKVRGRLLLRFPNNKSTETYKTTLSAHCAATINPLPHAIESKIDNWKRENP